MMSRSRGLSAESLVIVDSDYITKFRSCLNNKVKNTNIDNQTIILIPTDWDQRKQDAVVRSKDILSKIKRPALPAHLYVEDSSDDEYDDPMASKKKREKVCRIWKINFWRNCRLVFRWIFVFTFTMAITGPATALVAKRRLPHGTRKTVY